MEIKDKIKYGEIKSNSNRRRVPLQRYLVNLILK